MAGPRLKDSYNARNDTPRHDRGQRKGPARWPTRRCCPRKNHKADDLLCRSPPPCHYGILHPRERNEEKRRQEHAEQHVDPQQRRIEGAQAEAHDQDTEGSAKAVFHGVYVSTMSRDAKAGVAEDLLTRAVAALPAGRYLLAVSGGRDSMVLLEAFARVRGDAAAVATFDHGTGPPAQRAATFVADEARRRGLQTVSARRTSGGASTEQGWRAARWHFLRGAARDLAAVVVTAHTRDDQLETVVMRALRDTQRTGARGLAAMYAPSPIARPLLDVSRAEVRAWGEAHDVPFLEDPTNASREHLRNRIRHDLLPLLERSHPGFGASMLGLSRRAARWRADLTGVVDELCVRVASAVVVPADVLAPISPAGLAIVWPEIAARAGVMLDRRGTERLVAFTTQGKPGSGVPLSGGAGVRRTGSTFVVVKAAGAGEALYSIV